MRLILLILKNIFHEKLRYAHLIAFMKYNSLKKLLNFIYNEYERKMRKVVVSSKPYLINSEPTCYCNYKCPFCPTIKNDSRHGGFAPIELYEKIIKQIGKYTYLMTIHGWGEPLLYKNLTQIIKIAHDNRIFTVVTTNGYLLTKEISRKIISSKLDYLNLSIDGASEESYKKYRIGGSYEVVIQNLKNLIALKKEMHSATPFIEWQFLVFKHNEHEINAAKNIARKLGVDNIAFLPAYTEDASFDSSLKKHHLPKTSPLSKRSDCKHLWSTLAFHWNGELVSCCYDYQEKIPYGDLKTESIDQLWNNLKLQESRMIVKNGPENYSKDIYCSYCVRNIKPAEL